MADTEDTPDKSDKTGKKAVILEARKRYKACQEFEQTNRDNYKEDMKFIHVPGEQWDEQSKRERGKDRPMYEFNHTRVTAKNVINEMRANRPTAKFRPTEDADKPIAEAREGIAKNICSQSDFDSIRDYAAEHQVGGGMAAWRVDTLYSSDESFDQDIAISVIHNPLCIYADYACQDPLKRDANYWFVVTQMTKDAYKAKYGKREVLEFSADEMTGLDELNGDDRVWVAEYWRKEPIERHLCQLSDGTVIDKNDPEQVAKIPPGVMVVKERKFKGSKIVQYVISDDSVLEGPNDWAGTEFPFVIVYGDYVVVDGKPQWCGVARYMKDPQRAHNWAMTGVFESIAKAGEEFIWVTAKQAEGQADHWADADKRNLKYRLYNADPVAGGPPSRSGEPQVPVALIQAAQMSNDEMKASSGIFDASMGNTSNETSGRAIANRAAQGRIATFNFQDNMLKGVRRTYEILNGLIPKIYDTQRSIRILGEDGTEQFIQINDGVRDLNRGKYDLVITAGPSFATQRMEAAEAYIGLAQGNPQVMAGAADLIFKSMDLPFSDQIAERMRLLLPPPIQQAINKDKPIPPEAQAALMQAEQMMMAVQQQGQLVQQATQEAQGEKAAADKAKADLQVASANLKAQEAQLAADVADFRALVAQEQLKAQQQQVAMHSEVQSAQAEGMQQEREQLSVQLQQAWVDIQAQAADLMDSYAKQLAQIVLTKPEKPAKTKIARAKRVNGEIQIQIEEHDPTGQVPPVIRHGNSKRVGDEMVTTMVGN